MARGAGTFSEEQFREACAELQRPALVEAAWELLVETQGIRVYRLLDQVAVRPWRTAGLQSAGGGVRGSPEGRVGGAPGGWGGQCGAAAGGREPLGLQELRELALGWGCLQLTLTSASRGEWARYQSLVPGLRPDRASGLLQVDDRVKTWVCEFLLNPTHLPERDMSLAPRWVPVVSVWQGVCSD